MKKQRLILLIEILTVIFSFSSCDKKDEISVKGNENVITLVTTTSSGIPGASINILLNAAPNDRNDVWIDLNGNGKMDSGEHVTDYNVWRSYMIQTQTVRIYGRVTELQCYANNLIELDASKDPSLQHLNCYNNSLRNLDISKNTALVSLNCAENRLTSLLVGKNTVLETLDCSSNQLNDLNVSGCTSLSTLNCYYNSLNNLNISGCKSLAYLNADNNLLNSLNASGSRMLNDLECSNNSLTDLNVSGCTSLTRINCQDNKLSGAAVNQFISNLPIPTLSEGREIFFFDAVYSKEGNLCTTAQINSIVQRNWNIYKVVLGGYIPYSGV